MMVDGQSFGRSVGPLGHWPKELQRDKIDQRETFIDLEGLHPTHRNINCSFKRLERSWNPKAEEISLHTTLHV